MNNRLVIHIDMNSFFATTEQQANPLLRGVPVAVLGSSSKRAVVTASSIEAKKLGIKSGQPLHQAKRICPQIKTIVGESRKYNHILKKLVSILESYSDKIEIFSIDECFIDVTDTAHLFVDKITEKPSPKNPLSKQAINTNALQLTSNLKLQISDWHGAINIASIIKSEIKAQIGEWMSCSVGIAENKFLAKLGSDIKKPDGLVVIVPNSRHKILNSKNLNYKKNQKPTLESFKLLTVDEALTSSNLSDLCGIGEKTKEKLFKMGIKTIKDLRKTPYKTLEKEFGIYGFKIKNWSLGIDSSPVVNYKNQKEAKSFSKAITLERDVFSKKEIRKVLYFLSEALGVKMRKDDYWGKSIGVWIKFSSLYSVKKAKKIDKWICDGYDIFKYSEKILDEIKIDGSVRAVGVFISDIQPKRSVPVSMLEKEKVEEVLINTVDLINKKYGDFSLTRASACGLRPMSKLGTRHKDRKKLEI